MAKILLTSPPFSYAMTERDLDAVELFEALASEEAFVVAPGRPHDAAWDRIRLRHIDEKASRRFDEVQAAAAAMRPPEDS